MTRVSERLKRLSRVELCLLLLVSISLAYFCGGASGNQNARLDTIFSFVEPGTPDSGSFRINRFLTQPDVHYNTPDWSLYEGNYYANKAPGSAWLGIPCYALLYAAQTACGYSVDLPLLAILNSYLLNLWISVVFVSLAVVAFYRILLRLKLDPPRAALLCVGLFLGTAFFPYSTQIWGHPTAAAFLVFALLAAPLEALAWSP